MRDSSRRDISQRIFIFYGGGGKWIKYLHQIKMQLFWTNLNWRSAKSVKNASTWSLKRYYPTHSIWQKCMISVKKYYTMSKNSFSVDSRIMFFLISQHICRHLRKYIWLAWEILMLYTSNQVPEKFSLWIVNRIKGLNFSNLEKSFHRNIKLLNLL